MTMQIEKGVPIPQVTARAGKNVQLLRQMEVGDSVLFPNVESKKVMRFYRVAKNIGFKVLLRKEGSGVRMWRVPQDEGNGQDTSE